MNIPASYLFIPTSYLLGKSASYFLLAIHNAYNALLKKLFKDFSEEELANKITDHKTFIRICNSREKGSKHGLYSLEYGAAGIFCAYAIHHINKNSSFGIAAGLITAASLAHDTYELYNSYSTKNKTKI